MWLRCRSEDALATESSSFLAGRLIRFPTSTSCVHTANDRNAPLENCSTQPGGWADAGLVCSERPDREGEVVYVCLFEGQMEIERLQETQRSAAEKRYEAGKLVEFVCVCVQCTQVHLHVCSSSLRVWACGFALSLLKCPAGREEITGVLKMATEQ